MLQPDNSSERMCHRMAIKVCSAIACAVHVIMFIQERQDSTLKTKGSSQLEVCIRSVMMSQQICTLPTPATACQHSICLDTAFHQGLTEERQLQQQHQQQNDVAPELCIACTIHEMSAAPGHAFSAKTV